MRNLITLAVLCSAIMASGQMSEKFNQPIDSLTKYGWTFTNTFSISEDTPIEGSSSLVSGHENHISYVAISPKLNVTATGRVSFKYKFDRNRNNSTTLEIALIDTSGNQITLLGGLNIQPSTTIQTFIGQTNITGACRIRITYSVNNANARFVLDELNLRGITILPIKWVNHTLKRFPGYNQLRWTAEENSNTNRYEIQASDDGRTWRSVQVIRSEGKDQVKSYLFTDNYNKR